MLNFGTLEVIREDGQDYICRCNKCNTIDKYNKYALKNGSIKNCRQCKKIKGIEIGTVNKKGLQIKGYRENNNTLEVLVTCLNCAKEFYITKDQFKSDINCKYCSGKILKKASLLLNNKNEKNKTESSNPKKLDDTNKQKELAAKKLKELETEYSKKGLLTKDYTGQVVNGLQIIEQSIFKGDHICKCKCSYCNEVKISKLVLVLDGQIKCDNCKDNDYKFECPKCSQKLSRQTQYLGGVLKENNVFKITRAKLYSGEKLKCPTCGNIINLVEEANKADLVDTQRLLLETMDTSKYGDYEKINQTTGLAVSSKIAYIGRDGIARKNCLCLKHRKTLCLSDQQIKNYCHELCDNNFIKAVPLMKKIEPKKQKKQGEDNCFYY